MREKLVIIFVTLVMLGAALIAAVPANVSAQVDDRPILFASAKMGHRITVMEGSAMPITALENVGGKTLYDTDLRYECEDTAYIHNNIVSGLGEDIECIDIGDADNDGDNEVVVGTDGDNVLMYDGSGSSWTQTVIDINIGGDARCIGIGDPDNDNLNEVVVGTSSENLFMYEYLSATWYRRELDTNTGGTVLCLAIGDPDNDNENEIIIGTDNNEVYMYDKGYYVWGRTDVDSGLGGDVMGVAIGDPDNDNDEEIVVGTSDDFSIGNAGNVFIYEGSTWSWSRTTVDSSYGGRALIGDAENDGDTDIIVGSYHQIFTYTESGGTWYRYSLPLSGSYMITCIAYGDTDNDGANDIVVGNNGGILEKYTYDLTYTYWALEEIGSITSHPLCVAIGDADDDGNNEIVWGDYSGNVYISHYSSVAAAMICWMAHEIDIKEILPDDDEIKVKEFLVVPEIPVMFTFSAVLKGTYKSASGEVYEYPDSDHLRKLGYSPMPAKLHVTVVTSLKDLKMDAIADLEDCRVGDRAVDKKLNTAINNIKGSLDEKLWQDDTHLDPKHGRLVFDREKRAVRELNELIFYGQSVMQKIKNYVLNTNDPAGGVLSAGGLSQASNNDEKALLDFINDQTTTTFELLDEDVGLPTDSARHIIKHRDGKDKTPGTADDDLFDTINELERTIYHYSGEKDVMRTCKNAVNTLAQADRMLANLANTEAKKEVSEDFKKYKLLKQSMIELTAGDLELINNNFIKAMEHYKECWILTQKVMKNLKN
ncbi:MAG: VCBS repeat-containing protein [Thermoplasmata archaeon]|nr:MAG: VCBS repeat-containing protein [Thermoplasmata archaeon]